MDRFLTRSPLLAGLLTVWLFVIVGSFLTSLVLNYTRVSEASFYSFSYGINIVALLAGGWMSGRRSGRRGWYHGAVTALCYALLVFVIGLLAFDSPFGWQNVLHLCGALVTGALGGAIGVNTRA